VISAVTGYLHSTPAGVLLPGPKAIIKRFGRFKNRLPALANALQRDEDEVHPYKHYRAFLALMNDFLKGEQALGA
jgi:hypothetical protein